LVAVVLIPLTIAVALASVVVLKQSGTRSRAEEASQTSLVLDSLLRDRIDVYAEYVPSEALVAARENNLTGAQLDSLLGINFQADLKSARQAVDRQSAFGKQGPFSAAYARLVALRRSIDTGTATSVAVETFFNGLGSAVDQRWQSTFDGLQKEGGSSVSAATRNQVAALGASFSAFTAGLGEESLQSGGSLETVLTSVATPAEVQSLIVSNQRFGDAVSGFPGSLGPRGVVAWKALEADPLNKSFADYIRLAIAVGLQRGSPPFATNASAIGSIARSEVSWANSLTDLVLASSADLRSVTSDQATSATTTLYVLFASMVLLVLAAIGSAMVLSRAVRGPLARIVAAAESVGEGELDFSLLNESGPKELALAAGAFNEMSATLRAVQAQAIALSQGHLEDQVLQRSLPGRTGAALQSSLNMLQSSVRASEEQRNALFERATRDSMTGLLNRGAALEALEIDLSTVNRSHGELVLTVFFIDLDDLKHINDSMGHDGGDAAIKAIADVLRATTRTSDVVARFGGDEFVVGWLGSRDSEAPALLAKRITAHVASSEPEDPRLSHKLRCSIGVAVSQRHDDTVEELIGRADDALYVAKASGQGQIRWFESGSGLSEHARGAG
jgi:diguanylate cyclase (GGDEF)-like protein